MNQRQRDYAIERIRDVAAVKIASITEKFTTQEKKISTDEKMDLIRKGAVKLAKDASYHSNLISAFDFSKYEAEKKFDSAKADLIIAAVKDAARKAKDNIMLAGDAEALKAIEDFEKTISKF